MRHIIDRIRTVLSTTNFTASGQAIRQTFDRSQLYEPVAADRLLNTISSLCHVEIEVHERPERTLFGGVHKYRVLEIAGNENAVKAARQVYNMLDDLLETSAIRQEERESLVVRLDACLKDLTK